MKYRNVYASFDQSGNLCRGITFYADRLKQKEIARTTVSMKTHVADLSESAMKEFARKYIDVNYGTLCQYLDQSAAMDQRPLSDAALAYARSAQEVADHIVKVSCENTTSGSWVTYDKGIAKDLGMDAETVRHLAPAIESILWGKPEVSDVVVKSNGFDVTCFLNYCPNLDEDVYEDEQENIEEEIRVLRILPGKAPMDVTIPHTLNSLRKEVGGDIESLKISGDAEIILNGYGKLEGLQPNRHYGSDILVGPFLICGAKGENLCSLTDAQVEQYTQQFAQPEQFNLREQMGLAAFTM